MDVSEDEVLLGGEESALTSRAQTVEEGDEGEDASQAQEPEEEGEEKDIEVDVEEAEGSDEGEDVGVPQGDDDEEAVIPPKRGRGRPRGRPKGSGVGPGRPRGRGRGRPRGKGRLTTRSRRDRDEEPVIEVEYAEDGTERRFRRYGGQIYYIEGDEYVTGDLPEGDEKIDKDGNLLGGTFCGSMRSISQSQRSMLGRQFKAQTFILPSRDPKRKYMLAIDAARSSGFRDSLYYFRRNQLALKLNATQWEKDYLIEEGKLGSHLRTRSVTMITARSAYKLHGAKMIVSAYTTTSPRLLPFRQKLIYNRLKMVAG